MNLFSSKQSIFRVFFYVIWFSISSPGTHYLGSPDLLIGTIGRKTVAYPQDPDSFDHTLLEKGGIDVLKFFAVHHCHKSVLLWPQAICRNATLPYDC
jgi:hypothetical protein